MTPASKAPSSRICTVNSRQANLHGYGSKITGTPKNCLQGQHQHPKICSFEFCFFSLTRFGRRRSSTWICLRSPQKSNIIPKRPFSKAQGLKKIALSKPTSSTPPAFTLGRVTCLASATTSAARWANAPWA